MTTEQFAVVLHNWRALSAALQAAAIAAQWETHAGRPGMAAAGPDLRLAMVTEICPCGSGPCGCGSGPPRICSRPDRPSEVRRADCLRCVTHDWWRAGVDAVA